MENDTRKNDLYPRAAPKSRRPSPRTIRVPSRGGAATHPRTIRVPGRGVAATRLRTIRVPSRGDPPPRTIGVAATRLRRLRRGRGVGPAATEDPPQDWHAQPPNASKGGWFSFSDFLDMPHYHNIQVRMLGKDRFPYDVRAPVSGDDVHAAIRRADAHFAVVGVFELFEHTAALLARLAGVPLLGADLQRVRAAHAPGYVAFREHLENDAALRRRVFDANVHDQTLHVWAAERLCGQLRAFGLLELPACGADVGEKGRRFCASL